MDPIDYLDAMDSGEYVALSDPLFGPAAIVLLMIALVAWVWNLES